VRFAAAIFVTLVTLASSAMGEPVAYDAVIAQQRTTSETPDSTNGSRGADLGNVDTDAVAVANLTPEQAELMAEDPDWNAHASLYHAGGGGATGNDSLGCRPVAMRTVATDPRVIPRRTRLFIRETVGMRLADGTVHDGYWYASDTGGAIKGQRVDLYTGNGRASMQQARRLNQATLTIVRAGTFDGCPPATTARPAVLQMASN
jgi:3D (Asp-Asp-Asp) domain-containing protein